MPAPFLKVRAIAKSAFSSCVGTVLADVKIPARSSTDSYFPPVTLAGTIRPSDFELIRAAIIALVAQFFGMSVAFADFTASKPHPDGGFTGNTLTGAIKPSDLERLRGALKAYPTDETFALYVNTIGGDVDTALKIGKLLRDSKASVTVLPNENCFSACVLILAGAKQRTVHSLHSRGGARVGIHRPYDPNDQETTMEGQKRKQQQWEQRIKAFLNEVNVPVALYDEMIRVPPGQMRVLSVAELSKFGLNANDPYWEDAYETTEAKKLHITKEEYLRRQAFGKSYCARYRRDDRPFDDLVCEANILRGQRPDLNIGRK